MSLADWIVLPITAVFLAYSLYGTPLIVLGLWKYRKGRRYDPPGGEWDPPVVSVLVAVKNEEKVVGRLLDTLAKVDYPRESFEVVVVEDGSRDRTLEICNGYMERFPWIKVYHRGQSKGKADAMNFGFEKTRGEVIALFDADDIPEPDCIRKALRYFDRPEVGAVHGWHSALNFNESLVSKLSSFETFLYGLLNDAKYELGLFVTFSGSNTYLRRWALEKVGLWDVDSLVEDVEMSVRFARAGITTRLAPIVCWCETPAGLGSVVRQRIRWSGGNIQTGLKHWDSWRQLPWFLAADMSVLMVSPVLGPLLVAGWSLVGLGALRIGLTPRQVAPLLVGLGSIVVLSLVSMLTMVMSRVKAGRMNYVRLILATYPYTTMIALANAAGLLLVLLGFRRKMWFKTERTGYSDPASGPIQFC